MKCVLDNMLWIPHEAIDNELLINIRDELTVEAFKMDEPAEIVELFEDDYVKNCIGVPRAWGLERFGEEIEVEDLTTYPNLKWPDLQWPVGKYWWPGQKEGVDAVVAHFLDHGDYGGLLEASCGSGKTLMSLAVAASLHTPVLVTVHKGDLVDQWHETLEEFWPGLKGGHVQQNKLEYEGCHMVTAMAQTLYSRGTKIPQEFYKYFGLMVNDEGHRYPARTFEQVMRKPPARFRLPVSATWRRIDGMNCVWTMHAGDVIHVVDTPRLTGDYVQIPWETTLKDEQFRWAGSVSMPKFVTAISKVELYNNWLADNMHEAALAGRKIVMVTDRTLQCEVIKKKLAHRGFTDVGLYVGALKQPGLKRPKKLTKEQLKEAKNAQIILATYGMMGEGTNIPTLDTLFVATPHSEIEQVVGRIQRPVPKMRLLIVDPVFQTKWNKRKGSTRKKTYKKLGFIEKGSE